MKLAAIFLAASTGIVAGWAGHAYYADQAQKQACESYEWDCAHYLPRVLSQNRFRIGDLEENTLNGIINEIHPDATLNHCDRSIVYSMAQVGTQLRLNAEFEQQSLFRRSDSLDPQPLLQDAIDKAGSGFGCAIRRQNPDFFAQPQPELVERYLRTLSPS